MISPARRLAHRSLVRAIRDRVFSDRETDRILSGTALSPEDRRLYAKIYYGVTEKKITLDYILSQMSHIPLNRLEAEVLANLELGAYQILYLDRIPHHAVVKEAGEIAKETQRDSLSFVNAVLRRLITEKDRVPLLLEHSGKKGLSLRWGYPRYLVSLWQEAYGKEQCESILKEQNIPAALTVRVNLLKTTKEAFQAALAHQGVSFSPSPLCPNALILRDNPPPAELFGYQEGLFFVQDAAAGHAVERLEIQAGHRVLDLCAAPGGKSFAAACALGGEGEILALELYEKRVEIMQESVRRLGMESLIRLRQNDSTDPLSECGFDRVICDVPCSGWGTIAKKPDIRHKPAEEWKGLPEKQLAILKNAAEAVKTGGRILYSTCTLNPAENEAVTSRFLEEDGRFATRGERETIFPRGGENDGFYCEILEKLYD